MVFERVDVTAFSPVDRRILVPACLASAAFLKFTRSPLTLLPRLVPPSMQLALRGSGALGAALGVWYSYKAMYHVLAQHSPVAHGHQVQTLVVDGPYGQCRHPMYVGMLGTMMGLGIMQNTWWVGIMSVPFMAYVGGYIVPFEEKYLAKEFPEEWQDYAANVKRYGIL
ncbi:unnamed protein product [Durusdinium trenchii]|uniref:Protein-S-isoprenylcysteine O-methyltransferase n=1 Tax=Durusdinium trenchii TaxID=1381693 RepID=A0ABP0HAM0_9DINO